MCVYLVNIPEPVLYAIYTLAFPFDLRCESVTYNSYTMGTSDLPDMYTRSLGPVRGLRVYISGELSFYANGFTIFIVVLIAFDCGFRL